MLNCWNSGWPNFGAVAANDRAEVRPMNLIDRLLPYTPWGVYLYALALAFGA